jgi:cation:H+ antiporter
MTVAILFVLCALAILVAGTQLCRYGEEIARLTGLGTTWIGTVLVASVTSLPELVTGVSAVTTAQAPGVAVGDVLGSCVFNLVLIALLDMAQRPSSVFTAASRDHIIGAAFSALMLALVGAELVVGRTFGTGLLHISAVTPVVAILYLFAMRTVFQHERSHAKRDNAESRTVPRDALRRAIVRYAAASLVVVAAGIAVPHLATEIARILGWSHGFVGTSLVALTTSLPEMAVTVAAWRMRSIDLAIGNLVGSNLFNLLILTVDDVLYLPGPLLAHVSVAHALSAFAAIGMTATVIVALMAPPRARLLNLVSWSSGVLVLVFFANAWMHYRHPGG